MAGGQQGARRTPAPPNHKKLPRTTPSQLDRVLELLPRFRSENWPVARLVSESGVPRSRVRTILRNTNKRSRQGRPPFFTEAEEAVLAKYIRIQAILGSGLTPSAFREKCGEYIKTLSSALRAAAAAYFGGSTIPSRSFVSSFLGRWPDLRQYRVGTLEMGRARNSRPEVVARWYAALTLLFRHERITAARKVWNMDEMAVKAREIILNSRCTILRPTGLEKPELVVPDVGSAAAGCTAAFSVAASGDVAPPFLVVEGGTDGHAFVRTGGSNGSPGEVIPLSSILQDDAMVMRRTPAGFDKRYSTTLLAILPLSPTDSTPQRQRYRPSMGPRCTCLLGACASCWRPGST